MKRLLFLIIIAAICNAAYGLWEINYENVSNPETLTYLLQERFGITGSTYEFANGLKIDNATNNVFEWNENNEEIKWTFGDNFLSLSSGTGVVSFDFGTIDPVCDQITLENGQLIDGAINNRIEFSDNNEMFAFIFDANQLTLGTDSGITTIDFNDVDNLKGVESITVESGGWILLTAHDSVPTSTEGRIYWDDSENALKMYNGTSWIALGPGTGDNTLDDAYDQGGDGAGKAIDVDSGPVTLTVSDKDGNGALKLVQNDATTDPNALAIIMGAGSTGTAIIIDSQATGTDISGDNWSVTQAGVLTAVSADFTGAAGITLSNDETITNATDTEIKFASDTEDFSIDFVNNGINFKTGSDVDTVGWGDLDAHTGLNTLTFDAAASSITLPADSSGDNLTIQVTGTQDSHLIITSAGTSADALDINATGGGIDIDADDGIAIDAAGASGEDIVITNTGGSIKLEATEIATDAIVITASSAGGGIDITSQEDIDITTTGAPGEDITITNTGGSVNIKATEAAADAIVIDASTDAGGGIDIDFGTGNLVIVGNTAGADMTIDCDLFSIDGTGAANVSVTGGAGEDLTISQLGAADASLHLSSTGTGADALSMKVDGGATGGIEIAVTSDNGDITIDAYGAISIDPNGEASNFTLTTDDDAQDLTIGLIGATNSSIIVSSAGTGADAIKINSSAATGGIDIDCGTGTFDLLVTGGAFSIDGQNVASNISLATNDAADDLTIAVTGATNSSLILQSAGTGTDAIKIEATGGSIDIDASENNGDITIDAKGSISIDPNGESSNFSLATDGDAQDLTIGLTGATNSSIIINSTGTGTDAISLIASAGDISINSNANISFNDDTITNVGDIYVDDIIADANSNIVYPFKVLTVTIDVNDDDPTDDFKFDNDVANTIEQGVKVANIPAWCEVSSVLVRCIETVSDSNTLSIEIGTTSGGDEIHATSDCDTANDLMTTGAGAAPEVAVTGSIIPIYVNATPGVNWNQLREGRWVIMITYIDYAAAYAQKNP